jgi:MOSC domain-containing protein YiiM
VDAASPFRSSSRSAADQPVGSAGATAYRGGNASGAGPGRAIGARARGRSRHRARRLRILGAMSDGAGGRVLQVNISPGGVPKRPVAEAWVGRLGLQGDGHAEPGEHGGPHRAVCLFAIEAIRRVAAEGHPIAPGSCGENLTTEGIELGLLPVGTRLAIGDRLVLELSKPVTPCKTVARSFADGRFARISPVLHPSDARMYARVLVEGPVRPGDPIRVLPPLPESDAVAHLLLDRIEAAERFADRARWRRAADLGWPIEIVDDGDLAVGASATLAGPGFNWADGLRTVPHLLDRVVDTFRRVGSVGWLPLPAEDEAVDRLRPGSRTVGRLGVFGIEPDRVRAASGPSGEPVIVRPATRGEAATVGALIAAGLGREREADGRLGPIFAGTLELPGHVGLVARAGTEPVGAALLVARRRVGLVRHLAVAGDSGGRAGAIEAAFVRAAADEAVGLDCDLLAAVGWLGPGRPPRGLGRAGVLPAEPLVASGLVRIAERRLVRLDRAGLGAPAG